MIIIEKHIQPEKINTPAGESIQELIGAIAGSIRSHSLARITIPPGKASQPHFHKNTDESYLILSGRATMQINGEEFTLEPWETVLIEPKDVHQIFNHGDEDLVFLAACVPAWQPNDSFEIKSTKSK